MAALARDPAAERSLAVLRGLFRERLGRDVGVRLWDGTELTAPGAIFTLNVNAPYALRAALTPPLDVNPGKAFVEGWLDIGGELEAALDALERTITGLPKLALAKLAPLVLLLAPPPHVADDHRAQLAGRRHSKACDAAAVGFHYDQPVAFYRALLGARARVFVCVLGRRRHDARRRAAREARLRARQGAPAAGTIVSRHRLRLGSARDSRGGARRARVRDHAVQASARRGAPTSPRWVWATARVDLGDYRELGDEPFDTMASVGMVEHVGHAWD